MTERKAELPPLQYLVISDSLIRTIRETATMRAHNRGLTEQHWAHDSMLGVLDRLDRALCERDELLAERDHPETEDFFRGVPLEAAHQRARWPSEQDAGKTPADWFWLVGYLAGKCLAAHIAANRDKALHHTISTAAALANWHMAIKGSGNMRPGIAEKS